MNCTLIWDAVAATWTANALFVLPIALTAASQAVLSSLLGPVTTSTRYGSESWRDARQLLLSLDSCTAWAASAQATTKKLCRSAGSLDRSSTWTSCLLLPLQRAGVGFLLSRTSPPERFLSAEAKKSVRLAPAQARPRFFTVAVAVIFTSGLTEVATVSAETIRLGLAAA